MSDNNVYRIEDYRPHLVGDAVCLHCKHEWVAVAPTGSVRLECPKCGLYFGGRMQAMVLKGDFRIQCECGNTMFLIAPPFRVYCPCCGRDQEPDED